MERYLTDLPQGLTYEDLVIRFLRCLDEYVQSYLRRKFKKAFKTMKQRFVLTVPASYEDNNKNRMLEAAMKAGIAGGDRARITITSEADAAAVITIQQRMIHGDRPFRIGDGVMVLDCKSNP